MFWRKKKGKNKQKKITESLPYDHIKTNGDLHERPGIYATSIRATVVERRETGKYFPIVIHYNDYRH